MVTNSSLCDFNLSFQTMSILPPVFWLYAEFTSYIIYCLIITTATYFNIKLSKYKNEMFIRKRHKKILYGTNLAIISLIISSLIAQTILINATEHHRISYFLWITSLWITIYFFMVRNFYKK